MKLAEISSKFLGVECGTHQNQLDATPPLKQVTHDDHEKVRQRVTLVNLIKNNMGGLGKHATTYSTYLKRLSTYHALTHIMLSIGRYVRHNAHLNITLHFSL